MQIRRIIAIPSWGIFKDWTAEATGSTHQFGQQTLVLGHNGAGKSTLARLFEEVSQAQLGSVPKVDLSRIRIELTDSSGVQEVPCDSALVPKFLVFNRAFIRRNLAPLFDAAGQAMPLYVLGEKNLELEKDIAAATAEQESVDAAVTLISRSIDAADREMNELLDAVKMNVTDLLGSYDPNTYNSNTFNRLKARALLAAGGALLAEDEFRKTQVDLRQDDSSTSELIVCPAVPMLVELSSMARVALEYSVKAEAIPELTDNPVLQSWAFAGIALHAERTTCGFCSSELSETRRVALSRHFDDTYRQSMSLTSALRDAIGVAINRLDEIRAFIEAGAIAELARTGALNEQQLSDAREWTQSCVDYLRAMQALLDRRESDRFSAFTWEEPRPPADAAWSRLVDSVSAENRRREERMRNQIEVRKEASQRLLSHISASHSSKYAAQTESRDALATSRDAANAERMQAVSTLESLRSRRESNLNGRALAKQLTEDLKTYLFHAELTVRFQNAGDRAGYVFERSGTPATDLSDGEQSAISLLYFLCSLDTQDNGPGLASTIVVIDDPVSSLDQNALLSAYTFMRSRLKGEHGLRCRQLIILTHNHTFFRLALRGLSGALDKDLKKAKDDFGAGSSATQLPTRRATILEIRSELREQSGRVQRTPVLREIDGSSGAAASEYLNLFRYACEATHPDGQGLLGLAGNSTRRLLEGFVAFKTPAAVDLTNAVGQLGAAHGVKPEVANRLVAALHNSSHRADLDVHVHNHVADIQQEIRCALEFIKAVDPGHFEGLCKRTAQAPVLLLE